MNVINVKTQRLLLCLENFPWIYVSALMLEVQQTLFDEFLQIFIWI